MTTESVSGTLHLICGIFIQSYSNVVNQTAACLSNDVFVERVKNKWIKIQDPAGIQTQDLLNTS